MAEEKKKKGTGGLAAFIFVMCLVVVGGLGIYYQIMKKQHMRTQSNIPTTETEKLIAKDLSVGYPETPTEVMKLWGRINQCMYNSNLSDEEYTALLKQLRAMYSAELLEANKEDAHSAKLKSEITEFQNEKNKIVSYSADAGRTVQYKTVDGKKCAYARISYFIGKKNGYVKMFQDYILVQEDSKWKILGFQETEQEPATLDKADSGS